MKRSIFNSFFQDFLMTEVADFIIASLKIRCKSKPSKSVERFL